MVRFKFLSDPAAVVVLVVTLCFLGSGFTMAHAAQQEEFVIEGTDRKPAESAFTYEGRSDTSSSPEVEQTLDKPDVELPNTANSGESILRKDLTIKNELGSDTAINTDSDLTPSELFMFIVGTGAVLVVL